MYLVVGLCLIKCSRENFLLQFVSGPCNFFIKFTRLLLLTDVHPCMPVIINANLFSAPFVRTSFGARSFSVAASKILPSSSQDPPLPAGLPIHLTALLLRLRFGFYWPLFAFIIFTGTYCYKGYCGSGSRYSVGDGLMTTTQWGRRWNDISNIPFIKL